MPRKSTTLAKADPATIELAELETMLRDLGVPIGLVEADESNATMESILAELIQRDTLEGVLAAGTAESLEDFTGKVIRFHDVKWNPSEYPVDENNPTLALPYAVCKVSDPAEGEDGDPHVVTCGAAKVIVALAIAKRDKRFPFDARIVRNETSRGFRVLSLAAPGPSN